MSTPRPRSPQLLWPSSLARGIPTYRRPTLSPSPSLALVPLVHADFPELNKEHAFPSVDPPHNYLVSRKAIILSAIAFTLLLLTAVFIALFTSFVQGQEAAAAASSSAAAAASASRS